MNYSEAVAFITGAAQFGSRPGLTRVGALLDAMGNPQERLKFVHIAGTNGKGSTCAMTESILRASGYKVGMYISPYLEDYCERIQINRNMIAHDALAALTEEAAEHIKRLVASGGEHATKFEIETAVGLRYFADCGCDIVVLEVGLGGRLDATNIIKNTEIAAITSVSYDHTRILGNRLSDIAHEKCGILKQGCEAVSCASQHPETDAVIRRRCAELNIPLTVPDEKMLAVENADLSGSVFKYKEERYTVPLIGAHQIQNALTALEIANALRRRGWSVPQDAVVHGLEEAKWNGRLERVRDFPLCLIDGAHNQDAVSVLCGVIDSLLSDKRLITVMAMSDDKRYDICAPMLAQRSSHFIATQAQGIPHPLPAEKLAKAAENASCPVETIADVNKAVTRALSIAENSDVILACGSLYMIGGAKRVMLG